jgi:hypothetical protein
MGIFILVSEARLELARPFGHMVLNHARLPLRHSDENDGLPGEIRTRMPKQEILLTTSTFVAPEWVRGLDYAFIISRTNEI